MLPDVETLHSMGFESKEEYKLYVKILESFKNEVPIGIAS